MWRSFWINLCFIYLCLQEGLSQSLNKYSDFSEKCEDNKNIVITNVTHDNVTKPLTKELQFLNGKCKFNSSCIIENIAIQSNFGDPPTQWYEENLNLSVVKECVDKTLGYKGCPNETEILRKNNQYALVSEAYTTEKPYKRACNLSITVFPGTAAEFTKITCKTVDFIKNGGAFTCDDFPKYTNSSMTLSYVVDSEKRGGFLFLVKVSDVQKPTTIGSTGTTGKTGDGSQPTGQNMAKRPLGGILPGILVGILPRILVGILLLLIVIRKRVSSVVPTTVKMESNDNRYISACVYTDIDEMKPKEPFDKGSAHEPEKKHNMYTVPNKGKKSLPSCAPGKHGHGSTKEECQWSKCAAFTEASGDGLPVEAAYAVVEEGGFNTPECTQQRSQDKPEPTYQTLDPTITGWGENEVM